MAEKVKTTKELLIRSSNGRSIYEVYYEGGGELPKSLIGLYTSHIEAQKAIDTYLASKNRIPKDATDSDK